MSQKNNTDGTRTDYWKMELPHAPYLFFIGVGDYAIIKDQYKGKEVSYYVEKEYASVARKIFGNTPEMMAFFSKALGVEYPWIKYSQIVGRDYVSGAMENTTATLHQESAQQDARQLTDENKWENTIAHELFHQWFGDLVTSESWSNLTVNESFANYSEYLWLEYKYGKDAADEHNYTEMGEYLGSKSERKDSRWFDAVPDEVGHANGDDAGLARPRARKHQQRPFERRRRLPLRRIEPGKQVGGLGFARNCQGASTFERNAAVVELNALANFLAPKGRDNKTQGKRRFAAQPWVTTDNGI